MLKILKSKRAETLLEGVLSILLFAILVLSVVTMTKISQNIAKDTHDGIIEFNKNTADFYTVTLSGDVATATFEYSFKIDDGASVTGSTTPNITTNSDGMVKFKLNP